MPKPMSFALLFSGQGTQHPAMLPWLTDDGLVRAMCVRLGVDDWRHALMDPGWAARNDNAQTLLTGLALAAWSQLAPLLASPAAVAGYSVGELAAFSAAGVIDPTTAAALAPQRAAAMDHCAARAPGGLLAVSGLPEQQLEQLRVETGLALAIRNGDASVIFGGPVAALEDAERLAAAAGAQVTRLRVNVASHTPWMREAAESFSRTLAEVPFHAPSVVLFSNAADRIRDARSARVALAAQIAQTVRWDDCMEGVLARQVRCVLEVGPGQALARMWNQRYPTVPARACDDFRSAASIAAWLNGHADR
ncbi:acyltransferase domain-containing protein [Variovorax fucosicus]|uniref:acyltransferase domain-containing protein n=1 Tax=Variovorax fucosicus TaxID=3053517 RepID=UPI002578E3D1|nr:acyltransferase domain-containing protein [Variovorax sp. J22G47]MDM0059141.1 acyltransferase domain-containing protein [Variovorax sp. J22G47]